MGDDHSDLFVGHFAAKALEDRLQVGGAHMAHSGGNGAVCFWVDPGI